MKDDMLGCTLRIDSRLFAKFRYIADYDSRSANRDIEQYIKLRVKKFESEHGVIEIDALEENTDGR